MIYKLATVALLTGAVSIGMPSVAHAERPYANCSEAHADNLWDIPRGDPAYWDGGDRDHDGFACDS
jgi:hypothetical protein